MSSLRAPETREAFPLLQYISTRLLYTDFVWNVGSQVGRPVVREAAKAAGAYLIHGQDGYSAMRDASRAVSSFFTDPKAKQVYLRKRAASSCPFNCGVARGRGECRNNTCVCAAGWMGAACGAHVSKGDQ